MLHREGYKIIVITTIAIGISIIFIDKFVTDDFFNRGLSLLILLGYLFILQQFRNSKRSISPNANALFAPVDGRVKSIEHIPSTNSQQQGTRITIYVSPFQFHSVRAPFDGIVIERSNQRNGESNLKSETIEIQHQQYHDLKVRIEIFPAQFSQNASVYPVKNSTLIQGEEIGFINFDAKVIITFEYNSKLEVKIKDKVKAGTHRI